MRNSWAIRWLGVVLALVSFVGFASVGSSQEQPKPPVIPDKYTNLKVLPLDITKAQLLPIMKGFSKSSGQRCSHCHVATDDLSSADFASDEKPAKSEARELLRLIRNLK
ncbi:MAG TPA: hypothetical protein VNX88_19365 [Terriglobales bacterium]|jgi:hypothetical protein|nr:hypothetical protein [Terriglobales bacterium]